VCVAKQGGSTAFFTFASAVFDGPGRIGHSRWRHLTLNSAVTKAGLDPAKIGTCAKALRRPLPVDASVKLAKELNVNQTPTLLVNGRQVPANAPYDTIKQIIEYQEKLDGLTK
jgi:protein-disulfide isomerase